MNNVGIICDLENNKHPLLKSYYHSVVNLYGAEPIIVTCSADLEGIDLLFVGDDHYIPHKTILHAPDFIDRCNSDNIKVVVFTNERIFDAYFPWNVDNYKAITKIKNLYHYAIDVDDCKKLGIRLCRSAPSKYFAPKLASLEKDKTDSTIFIGKTNQQCKSYNERGEVLRDAGILIFIHPPTVSTWAKYMRMYSGHRFVFSPIGNGNFFTMRFYEALAVGSIPIHQVRHDTLEYYDIEAKFDDCIFFEDPREVPEKVKNCTFKKSHNVLWMEDWMKVLLTDDNLLQ